MSATPGSWAKEGFLEGHRLAQLAVLAVAATIGFVHYVLGEIVGLGPATTTRITTRWSAHDCQFGRCEQSHADVA